MSTLDARLAERVADWQRRLLQLDKRNNLLYFKPNRSTVTFANETPDGISSRLDSTRRGLRFPYAERGRRASPPTPDTGATAMEDDAPEQLVNQQAGDVETTHEVLDLQRRLSSLQKREREWQEEQGLNVLFLALGFLNWTDEAGEPARSPLVLIPCDLSRASPRDPFSFQREDDDAILNATLGHKLSELGMELPDYDSEQSVSSYLQQVRNRIRRRRDWSIDEETVLGTFAYSKLAMFEDLGRMASGAITHPLIRQLAGASRNPTDTAVSTGASAFPSAERLEGGGLDDLLDVRDQFAVLDADFSQLQAIETVRHGDHLVIHGPPGTGKSQTIANIVATLLADGKRVLFVSEKTAALDVVKRRLEEVNLGVFCLDMHSERGKKSSVYEQLRAAVRDPRAQVGPRVSTEALITHRDRLNRVVRLLHEKQEPLKQSIHGVQGQFARVRHFPQVDFSTAEIKGLTEERLVRIATVARRIELRPSEFHEHETSRWSPLAVDRGSVQLPDLIRADMRDLADALAAIRSVLGEAASWLGVHAPAAVGDAEQLSELAGLLAYAPSAPPEWFDDGRVTRLGRLAQEQQAQQEERRDLSSGLDEWFESGQQGVDYRSVSEGLLLTPVETGRLAEVLGDGWSARLGANPGRVVTQLEATISSLKELVQHTEALAERIGAPPPSTVDEITKLAGVANQIGRVSPVPDGWLRSRGTAESRGLMSSAREEARELTEFERDLGERFSAAVVDVVDEQMLIRYRTDHQSFWRRIGGQYKADQRILRGNLRHPGTLSLEEGLACVELSLQVRNRRASWAATSEELTGALGTRFRDRDTDWESISRALGEVDEIISSWPDDRGQLDRVLVSEELRRELERAISAVEESKIGYQEAAEALGDTGDRGSANGFQDALDQANSALDSCSRIAGVSASIYEGLARTPEDLSELRRIADTFTRLHVIEREDERTADQLTDDFGPFFAGVETDWGMALEALDWVKEFLARTPARLGTRLLGHATSPTGPGEYQHRESLVREALSAFEGRVSALDLRFDAGHTAWGAWRDAPFDELERWGIEITEHADSAAPWVEYQAAVRDLDAELGSGTTELIRATTDLASELPGIVERRLLAAWLDHQSELHPELGDFTSRDHEETRAQFRSLDRALPQAAQQRVRERCFTGYPDQYQTRTQAGQLGTLQGELSKQRRQMPVRRLFSRIPNLLQTLKPCFLMSPLAVSQYVPSNGLASEALTFDTVIFDEASQIFPEDAIPAIERARQVVVVGDEHQLPPTGFFRRGLADDDGLDDEDDEDDSFGGRESILDVMIGMLGASVAEQYLSVHYRSRSESLIRFSNHHFYEDRLLTFPGPQSSGLQGAIRDVYVKDGIYDAGATRTNRGEAEAVVDLVFELMRTRPPGESVGVVALSRAQSNLIEALVEQRRLIERDLDERFSEDRVERFFVKNLENVQGDERDHMILSIGYGPIASGGVPNRFGPINNPHGGQRRLNVAVSRARRTMTVVHSLRAEDIVADNPGARLLRRYLEFARDPDSAFLAQVSSVGGEPESPFEEAVRDALIRRGHRVDGQIGVSGYRIDLAILSEDGTRYDLGVECDGATYHSSPTARDRDWLRQEVLEGLGWTIKRVWSTSWVRNPEGSIQEIEAALEQARTRTARDDEDPPGGGGGAKIRPSRPSPDAGSGASGLELPTAAAPLFEDYREVGRPTGELWSDIQRAGNGKLAEQIAYIVDAEGPIALEIVLERLRDWYGVGRVGPRIRERIETAVRTAIRERGIRWENSSPLSGLRQFLQTTDAQIRPVPRRPSGTVRPIDRIADSELDAGLLLVAKKTFGATRDELVTETARQFGFDRTGPNIANSLNRRVNRLIESGSLGVEGEMLLAGTEDSPAR